MSIKTSNTLSNLLVKAKILTQDQIAEAAQFHQGPDDCLEDALIAKKWVTKSTLLTLLSDHYQIPFVSVPEKIDIQILKILPEHLIDMFKAIPLHVEADVVTIGLINPGNTNALDRISVTTGLTVKAVGILESDFKKFFSKYFEDTTMSEILKEIEIYQKEFNLPTKDEVLDETQSHPMVKLVDTIFSLALRRRASDIHIEPQDDYALIRFRVDGILQTIQIIPKQAVRGLISRIKIMGQMDITERRTPQDGQFRHTVLSRDVDVRVNSIPSRYGEKLALRLLDRRNFLISLDLIGMPTETQEKIEKTISKPNGLVLVTGPTGSGKTTTLYALVQKLRSPRLNIMTLEDPIEYELMAGRKREGGITQIQVNPKVGLSFASGLRACLRQDPDVIFVGEIRDKETAEVSISSALTGHMVLSSLHTNGAIQTITRMLDMGVEPFLVVSACRVIIAQRLVRVLCNHCKQPYTPPSDALERLGLETNQGISFYRPIGCGNCLQQGYWGRTGVFEMLELDNNINKLILSKKSPGEIFKYAMEKQNFKTLKQQGLDLVCQGITTIEEVLRGLPGL